MQKEAKMNSLMHRQNGPESPAFQLDTEVVHASFELDHAVGALVSPISVSTSTLRVAYCLFLLLCGCA